MPKYSGTKRVSNCYSGNRSQCSVNRDKGQGEGEESPLAWPIFNCHTWISKDECICECEYLCICEYVHLCMFNLSNYTNCCCCSRAGQGTKAATESVRQKQPHKIQDTNYKLQDTSHIRYKPARLWQTAAAATCFKYTTLITFPFKLKETLFGNCLKQWTDNGGEVTRREEMGGSGPLARQEHGRY